LIIRNGPSDKVYRVAETLLLKKAS
jgi:hypothetical protein